jgi:hypothetical protein
MSDGLTRFLGSDQEQWTLEQCYAGVTIGILFSEESADRQEKFFSSHATLRPKIAQSFDALIDHFRQTATHARLGELEQQLRKFSLPYRSHQ